MRDRRMVMAAIAVLALLALVAWTEQPDCAPETRTVRARGEAEVRVVPDEVMLTLGVLTWNKVLDVARDENDAIVRRLLAETGNMGIPAEHVQTDYLSVEPRYRDDYYEKRDFVGFFVYKAVAIRLRDLAKFEELLSRALDAGVNYVLGVDFRTTELRKYRDEARALAVKAAQEKAGALAAGLGQTLGKPLAVEEEQSGWWSGYGSWWGRRWGGAMSQNVVQEFAGEALGVDSAVAPGQISVRASVAVSFGLSD